MARMDVYQPQTQVERGVTRYFEELQKVPDVREERVMEVQQAIANGTFETPERIDGTVRILQKELRG